jgi:hypothetical protein
MKKFLFCLTIAAFGFTSCSKFDSFEDQVTGKWRSTLVEIGTVDVTAFNSIELDLQESLEFETELRTTGITGEVTTSYAGDWIAKEDQQEIVLVYDNGTNEKYDITDITKTSMSATTIVDGVKRVIEFSREEE